MTVRRLRIQDLRNIQGAELDLAQVNVLAGENGSGKTSVLEALYLLGSAKSFRASRPEAVIRDQSPSCTVFAQIADPGSSASTAIGVTRSRSGDFEGRIQGRAVQNTAELARLLPIQVLNSASFDLLEGGPKSRRQFLDWGVFHVEHAFHPAWLDAQKTLRQRNALLRHARIAPAELQVWDDRLAASAAVLDALRRRYFEAFYPEFEATLGELLAIEGLELGYYRGWDRERDLKDVLGEQFERDHERGFTHSGPHRADIRLRKLGRNAEEVLSRGQQKLVVSAMKLAQARLFSAMRGRHCLFLVDDLPAELDRGHREQLCSVLSRLECQVVVSCVDADDLDGCWAGVPEDAIRRFHVEQGAIRVVGA